MGIAHICQALGAGGAEVRNVRVQVPETVPLGWGVWYQVRSAEGRVWELIQERSPQWVREKQARPVHSPLFSGVIPSWGGGEPLDGLARWESAFSMGPNPPSGSNGTCSREHFKCARDVHATA